MKKWISYATPFFVVGVAVFLFITFYTKHSSDKDLGNKAYVSRNFEEAIYYYEQNRSSLTQEELLKLADSYYRTGQLEKAIRLYESMFKNKEVTNEQLAEFYLKVGEWEKENKNFDKALSFYEKALQKSQNVSTKIKIKKEIGYFISEHPTDETIPKGLKYLIEVSELPTEKENTDLLYRIGNLAYFSFETEYAIQYWNKVIQLNHRYIPAYEKLGIAYLDQKSYKQAMDMFQKALSYEPRNWRAFFGLAECYYHSGNKNMAVSFYQQTLSINPQHLPSHYQLAEIYLERGDKKAATEHLYKIVKIDSKSSLGQKAKEKLEELIPKVQ